MKILSLLSLILTIFIWVPKAQVSQDALNQFATLPILHEGRVKPVETWARSLLLQFSGKSTYQKIPALRVVSEILFGTDSVQNFSIFLINNPDVATAIGIESSDDRRYSHADLSRGLFKLQTLATQAEKIESNKRNIIQQEILRTWYNYQLFNDLRNAFIYNRIHPEFTLSDSLLKVQLGFAPNQNNFSFYDLYRKGNLLAERLEKLPGMEQVSETENDSTHQHSKTDSVIIEWSKTDSLAYNMAKGLYQWASYYQQSPFTIVPLDFHDQELWFSPWDILNSRMTGVEYLNTALNILSAMDSSWRSGDSQSFIFYTEKLAALGLEKAPRLVKPNKLKAELIYNRLDGFYRAELLYGLALLITLLIYAGLPTRLNFISTLLISLGFLIHLSAMSLRMYITGRPPVTNLFETFMFVSLTSVLAGLILTKLRSKDPLGNLLAALPGLVLLLISGKFAAEGDTMKVLVAVLDSNFWLTTHVITISLGYMGCVVAGVAGHVWIFQALIGRSSDSQMHKTYQSMMGILAFGLILSFIGTVLGGIWADQSWGRFWGWDPKENGALLIVLWCAVLYHGRRCGWFHPLGMAIGTVIGIIIVMLAWFGINLLGVGLHSYGFTSGIAGALITYIVIQVLFLLVTVPWVLRKGYKI
jgi:ABC-type transport system involved in cytochrome c biogenesis permease subunit